MSIQRGEIWLVNLDPSVGDEIRKTRPAVVVSTDVVGVLSLRVIAPITAWQPKFATCDWLIRIDPDSENLLEKPSVVDTFQVRSVSLQRFIRRLGCLNFDDMSRVADGLRSVLEI